MKAICVGCGRAKRRPGQRCPYCRLDPKLDPEALVRSVYLSTGRFDDPDEAHAYGATLDVIARELQAGTPPRFEESELRRLRAQRDLVSAVPLSAVRGALLRLFLPAILFLAGLLGLLGLLEWLLPRR